MLCLSVLGGVPHLLAVPWLCDRWWVPYHVYIDRGQAIIQQSKVLWGSPHLHPSRWRYFLLNINNWTPWRNQLETTLLFMLKVVQTLTGTAWPPCALPVSLTMTGSFALKIPVWNRILQPFLLLLGWIQGTLAFAILSLSFCPPKVTWRDGCSSPRRRPKSGLSSPLDSCSVPPIGRHPHRLLCRLSPFWILCHWLPESYWEQLFISLKIVQEESPQ